jgi:RluA family pseudouridine synthase
MAELIVPAGSEPMRLDQFVARTVPGASRRKLKDVTLRLNGRIARHGDIVHAGDVVTVPESLVAVPELRPNPEMRIPVLYQDEEMVALDKPPGTASVALREDDTATVANYLAATFPATRTIGPPLEAGLVHRLDHDTSGVIVAALDRESYAELRDQFSSGRVEKEYIALVVGDIADAGRVEIPIAHDPHRAARMVICDDPDKAERLGARQASTGYQPVIRYGGATLVRLRMRTGVRHQIRVHLAAIGHPIVADRLYGQPSPWMARQALHASRVTLTHPALGNELSIESPLPRDLETALERVPRNRRSRL